MPSPGAIVLMTSSDVASPARWASRAWYQLVFRPRYRAIRLIEPHGEGLDRRWFPDATPGSGDDLLNHHFELGEVDGLGHVGRESGIPAALDVFFHAVAGQGDRRDRSAPVDDLAHQLQAAAVGQADVA